MCDEDALLPAAKWWAYQFAREVVEAKLAVMARHTALKHLD